MPKRAIAWALILGIALLTLPAQAETRVALVIGNSDYELISPLANPENDAALMAQTLRTVGFDVVEAKNADQRTMKRAISDFGRRLEAAGKDGVGLFYYAGHAVEARGVNYLIPLEAPIEREGDLDIEAVSAQWVLTQMEIAGNGLNVVILDSCRNNPYKGAFRAATRGLARMRAPTGSYIAYAAAPGELASDGSGSNSPYTAALAAAIREPGLKLEDAFKRVRARVHRQSGGKQTPWEEGSVIGDFYFVPQGSTVTVTPPGAPPAQPQPVFDARALELVFWDGTKGSDNPATFEAYLDQYPNGIFAALARIRLEELKAAAETAALIPPSTPAPQPAPAATDFSISNLGAWRICQGCAELAERVVPAAVNISTTTELGRTTSLGSGFIVDPAGIVVTGASLIEGADTIMVRLADGTAFDAELLGTAPSRNLAVLRITADTPLPYLSFDDSGGPRLSDGVMAVGNPFGLGPTVTVGLVTGLDSEVAGTPSGRVIKINSVHSRGNLGGPLIALDGRVIGLITDTESETGTRQTAVAVPASAVDGLVARLVASSGLTLSRPGTGKQGARAAVVDCIRCAALARGGAEATVSIETKEGGAGTGLGFLIDPAGYIVTNHHVIAGASRITVTLHDRSSHAATLVGSDTKTDLALLKISVARPLTALSFENAQPPRVGEPVMVIRSPVPSGPFASLGLVSARGRDINASSYDDFIQTDAAINRGDSGGPMLNLDGNVIGVNTAIFSPSGDSIGISFAIPSDLAKNVVMQLRQFGKVRRGWLGVRIQTVTEELAEALGLASPRGALIAGVTPGSPAEKAGLELGDVILMYAGMEVREMRQVPRMVAGTAVGSRVGLVVWRKGREQRMSVTIEVLDSKVLAAAMPAPAPQPETKAEVPETRKALRRVNVRSGPSTSHGKVQVLEPGERVAVLGKEPGKDWYRIRRPGGQIGFVYAPLLSAPETAVEETRIAALGLRVGPVTPELRKRFKLAYEAEGVVVLTVEADGSGVEKGLREGDLVIEMGKEPVAYPREVSRHVDQARRAGRKSILLLVSRDRRLRFVVLSLE